jgi:hypothetical protein
MFERKGPALEAKPPRPQMHIYFFNWTISGTTEIKATSLERAEKKWTEDRADWITQQMEGVPGTTTDQTEAQLTFVYDAVSGVTQPNEDTEDLSAEIERLRIERYAGSRAGRAEAKEEAQGA